MAKDYEKKLEEGRAVQDMIQTEGWQIVKGRIKREIEDERIALKEVKKQPAFDMLVDFMEHQKKMEGLEMALGIVDELLRDKTDAENNLR